MQFLRIAAGAIIVLGAGAGGMYLTDRLLAAPGSAQTTVPTSQNPLLVDTQPVEMVTFSEQVRAVGTTQAVRAVDLMPDASGRVRQVAFQPGDSVAEGDLLVQLDDRAEQASLKAAEATLAEARAAFERQQTLNRAGSASDAAYQGAQASLLRAEAERDRAALQLTNRQLTAPFAGVVGLTDVVEGQLIDTSTLVTTLDDLSVIEVAFRVPEILLPRLRTGQRLALGSAAWPGRIFDGTITGIDTRVDVATRSVALRAEVANDDRALAGGMFMQVDLVIEERLRPAVPEQALSVDGPRMLVHLVEDGVARQIEIATGQVRGGLVEVTSGIEAGTDPAPQVIVTNLQRLRPGIAVTAQPLALAPVGGAP